MHSLLLSLFDSLGTRTPCNIKNLEAIIACINTVNDQDSPNTIKKYDINADGDNLLHVAARQSNHDAFSIIYDFMLDEPDSSMYFCANSEGFTPLHIAYASGNVPALKLLIEGMPIDNLNTADNDGLSVLFHAVKANDLSTCRTLVSAGASLAGQTTDGKDIVILAAEYGDAELIDFILIGNLCDPFSEDCTITPLEAAIKRKNLETTQRLIQLGAAVGCELPKSIQRLDVDYSDCLLLGTTIEYEAFKPTHSLHDLFHIYKIINGDPKNPIFDMWEKYVWLQKQMPRHSENNELSELYYLLVKRSAVPSLYMLARLTILDHPSVCTEEQLQHICHEKDNIHSEAVYTSIASLIWGQTSMLSPNACIDKENEDEAQLNDLSEKKLQLRSHISKLNQLKESLEQLNYPYKPVYFTVGTIHLLSFCVIILAFLVFCTMAITGSILVSKSSQYNHCDDEPSGGMCDKAVGYFIPGILLLNFSIVPCIPLVVSSVVFCLLSLIGTSMKQTQCCPDSHSNVEKNRLPQNIKGLLSRIENALSRELELCDEEDTVREALLSHREQFQQTETVADCYDAVDSLISFHESQYELLSKLKSRPWTKASHIYLPRQAFWHVDTTNFESDGDAMQVGSVSGSDSEPHSTSLELTPLLV